MSVSIVNKFNSVVLASVLTTMLAPDARADDLALQSFPMPTDAPLSFITSDVASYADQDRSPNQVSVVNSSALEIEGNAWKSIHHNHVVQENSYIQFDYATLSEGEMHGLTFITDDGNATYDPTHYIRIDGTANISRYVGPNPELYTAPKGEKQTITVNLSDFYPVGTNITDIVFVNDHDVENPTAKANFSNIYVYNQILGFPMPTDAPLSFITSDVASYADQDRSPNQVSVVNSSALEIEGNAWKSIHHNHVVQENSYIQFDYATLSEGEMHGLTFITDDGNATYDPTHYIRIDGTANISRYVGPNPELYTAPKGEKQTITVNLSDFYPVGTNITDIVFVNDHDVENPTAKANFSNIYVYNQLPSASVTLECSMDIKEYIGGSGVDTINCSKLDKAIEIDLERGDGRFGKDLRKFTSIENIIGTDLAAFQGDFLYGDNQSNEFLAGKGPDVIRPRGGVDFIDGGDGFDKVEYPDSPEAIRIDLKYYGNYGLPMGQGGSADGDQYRWIEAYGGSKFDDTFIGDEYDNVFEGNEGNDTYDLGGGRDQVNDVSGDDTYIYTSGADIYSDTNGHDTIIFSENISPADAYVYRNIITFDNDNYITVNDINQFETFQFTDQESSLPVELSLEQFKAASAGVGPGNPEPTPDNHNPIIGNNKFSVDEDTTIELDPLANVTDLDNDYLTITSCTPPMNGAILSWAVEENNTLLYTPKHEYNGTDSFFCTVMDDRGGQSTGKINITVVPDITEVETYLYLIMSARNSYGYGQNSKPASAYFNGPYAQISFDRPTRLENDACITDDENIAVSNYKIQIGVEQGVYGYEDIWSADSVHANCIPSGERDEKCDVEIVTCTEDNYYIEGFYDNFDQ